MKITLQGAYNARDLCDIVTPYGKIKKGRLLRSCELSRLTETDVLKLRAAGLKRIIDLRTATERENTPDVNIPDVEYVNIPVIRATTFGISYEKSDGREIAEMLEAGFERMNARGENYGEHMNLLYRQFACSDFSRNAYGDFLRLLAEKPTEEATLWHCSAGKDRVGTCTALLLWCLGASEKQIFDDYMLTNEQSCEHTLEILNKASGYVSEANLKLIQKMLEVHESYLKDFFNEIKLRYGTVKSFLEACGVTERHLILLKKNYLE